jgi:hypothetical protein
LSNSGSSYRPGFESEDAWDAHHWRGVATEHLAEAEEARAALHRTEHAYEVVAEKARNFEAATRHSEERLAKFNSSDIHPISFDETEDWQCLRHGSCPPVLALREWQREYDLRSISREAQNEGSMAPDAQFEGSVGNWKAGSGSVATGDRAMPDRSRKVRCGVIAANGRRCSKQASTQPHEHDFSIPVGDDRGSYRLYESGG